MIKNLVVSGCSFTDDYDGKTWPYYIADNIKDCCVYNLSFPGAGNFYIADTVRNFLINEKPNPAETLVMVMWSGMTRKDLLVDRPYYDMLPDTCKITHYNNHYVVCGGFAGSWQDPPQNILLKPLFSSYFKFTDIPAMAYDTLMHMANLRYFLERNNYSYKFLSYVNYWKNTPGVLVGRNHDYSLTYYSRPEVLNEVGDNWIWADEEKNCIYEYACKHNMLSKDNFHPATEAHNLFTKEILLPNLKEFLE